MLEMRIYVYMNERDEEYYFQSLHSIKNVSKFLFFWNCKGQQKRLVNLT
jgi:hypothetical protein